MRKVSGPLDGSTILVAEDSALLALELESILSAAGACVRGPYASNPDALEGLGRGGVDAALLDINLGQTLSVPIAEALQRAGVPFAFGTGYDLAEVLPARWHDLPCLAKPYSEEELLHCLANLIGAGDDD
jgi:DNA-binding LytR/AlgR family response regulator